MHKQIFGGAFTFAGAVRVPTVWLVVPPGSQNLRVEIMVLTVSGLVVTAQLCREDGARNLGWPVRAGGPGTCIEEIESTGVMRVGLDLWSEAAPWGSAQFVATLMADVE